MKTTLTFIILSLLSISVFSQIIYLEDFEGVTMDAVAVSVTNTVTGGPMTANNEDGLIPNAAVSYVTDAWVLREDFIYDPSDTVSFSTSWYTPPGQADDWMATPLINIPETGATLSWDAVAPDEGFPDGYSVYVSATGNTPADFEATTAIFTIGAENPVWTTRSVSLDPYAGQDIYIAFRNNSNDQFLLMVDDIQVAGDLPPDVAVSGAAFPSEYFFATFNHTRGCPFEVFGQVTNNDDDENATEVSLCCNIYRDSVENLLITLVSDTVEALSPGADTIIEFDSTYAPMANGVYILEYIVKSAENDTINENDTFNVLMIVQDTIMSRDVNTVTGSLGIGAGSAGTLGQNYETKGVDLLLGVDIFLNAPVEGDTFSLSLWKTDSIDGPPVMEIAQTATQTVTAENIGTLTRVFFNQPIVLQPCTYFIGINESEANNITIGTSGSIFTPSTTWVIFGANPWQNNEAFNFFVSYIMRPVFAPCKDSLNFNAELLGSEMNINNQAALNITSTDTIRSGAMNIVYDAGLDIDLLEGFVVELGASFEAFINGCLNNLFQQPGQSSAPERLPNQSSKYPKKQFVERE